MMKLTKCAFFISENIIKISKRTLINGTALGMTGYEKNRQYHKSKKNISQFLYHINNSPTQDLLHMTKLWTFRTTDLDGELDLLEHGLTRIYENHGDIQAERDIRELYTLGPSTMRMFHYLDLPKKALKFHSRFNNNSFFDSKTTLLVLMDLLFLHGKYEEILNVYLAYTVERKREASSILRAMVIAACYKLNTPESFRYAQDLCNDSNNKSEPQMSQGVCFVAMLALNRNEPKLALSLLSKSENYTAPMNIKLLAMAELNDWHGVADLLCLIRTKRWQETNGKNYRVSTEVFQKLRDNVSEKDLSVKEYERCNQVLFNFHKSPDLLQKVSIDELLCWPIGSIPKIKTEDEINDIDQKTTNNIAEK